MTTSNEMDRRTFLRNAGIAGAAGVALATGVGAYILTRDEDDGDGAGSESTVESLVAHRRDGELPADPQSDEWLDLDPVAVPLQMQQVTSPQPGELAIAEVRVRALHNGTSLAVHVQWEDPNLDEIEAVGRFRDAVAIQIPVSEETDAAAPSTPFTMGGPGKPVHILHWKASWQADVDRGRLTVKDAFPNMYNDVTPEDLMGEDKAIVFYPGVFAGNSLSARERTSPVEELVAAVFGSLTTHELQEATGRGVHDGAAWRVVMSMPLASGDTSKPQLRPGQSVPIAFALWSGSHLNRGARKQYAPWVPLTLEEA